MRLVALERPGRGESLVLVWETWIGEWPGGCCWKRLCRVEIRNKVVVSQPPAFLEIDGLDTVWSVLNRRVYRRRPKKSDGGLGLRLLKAALVSTPRATSSAG